VATSYGAPEPRLLAWRRSLSVRCGTVGAMENKADLLMLRGVLADCADCGDEQVFVPVDGSHPTGEYCCTTCDAAVFLVSVLAADRPRRRSGDRVA
jgi:hypothetical protein